MGLHEDEMYGEDFLSHKRQNGSIWGETSSSFGSSHQGSSSIWDE
ncbi:MAG: hypothetical protein Q4P78_08945 [Rothia sp. (in: high G+C Gram-positive bacteria)]|nr:hypothetical protein [Rothia sp. (in: high G+C Gram-positive bacteria)]MDO5751301.1 hypothetical protein [Rothia sp. (in: high G+C Gram-positive bacteria)]